MATRALSPFFMRDRYGPVPPIETDNPNAAYMVWQTGVLLSISHDVKQLTDRVDEIDTFRKQEVRQDNLETDLKEKALAKKVQRSQTINDTKRYFEIAAIAVTVVLATRAFALIDSFKEIIF